MPETLEIPLSAIKEWTEKETKSLVEPLRANAKKYLNDTKNKLEELLDSSEKLIEDADKELAKGSKKTYRRAKALHKLAEGFSSSIEEIKIPEEISAITLKETAEQIGKTLRTMDIERTRWWRPISPFFIMSRRRFDVMLKRAQDSLRAFDDFLAKEYVKAETAENVSSKIEELKQFIAHLREIEESKETRKQDEIVLENQITETQQKIDAIQTKDEIVELAQTNDTIEQLTEKVRHELRHLQKPLMKFQTLVNNPGYSLTPEATQKLNDYVSNPFDALATETDGYPVLKVILQKMDTAIDNDKVKLKSTRLRKAKDQIDSILNKKALVVLQQRCRETLSKKGELAESGIISETRNERAELHDCLKDLERKKKVLENRDRLFEKDHKDAQTRVEEQKKLLEKSVFEVSNKNIRVVIG
ncbi:MAG: hypothetical protein WC325_00610 [Candidatus Bathyarchaeia archaeon]